MQDSQRLKRFEVWCPDYDQDPEDGQKISARDHYQAATEWAEWSDHDSADYLIVNGEDVIVMVRDLDDRSLFAIRVMGESIPHYTAHDADYSA